jgi:hypothetical protein
MLATSFAKADKDWGVYEFEDPEGAIHWISLTIEDKKITGDVTKYLDESLKEKVAVGKFSGRIMPGIKEIKMLSITFDEKSKKALSNIVTDEKGGSYWKLDPNNTLTVPMFYFIRQGVAEDATFHYLSPN